MTIEDESIDEAIDEVTDEATDEATAVGDEISRDDDMPVEESDKDDAGRKRGKKAGSRLIDPAYNRLLPVSLLAALIGLLLGPIPAVVGVLVAKIVFYPLFVVAPLLMYLFNKLLKGGRDIRALIVFAVFSLVSAYLAALTCQVTLFYLSDANITIFQIPIITTMVLGRLGALPASASAYVYPLLFTALGVAIAALLLRGKPAELGIRNSEFGIDKAESAGETTES